MREIIGWIGLGILFLAWALQLTKYRKKFFLFSGIASMILTFYAILINNLAFIVVNGFIAIVSFAKAWHFHIGFKENRKTIRKINNNKAYKR